MVKFILANQKREMRHHAFLAAAQAGQLELMKFIFESTVAPGASMPSRGTLPKVVTWKYFHETFPRGCLAEIVAGAAGNGQLEVVNYLDFIDASASVVTNATGYPEFGTCARGDTCTARCKTRTAQMDRAAAGGHLDDVEFLHHSTSRDCTSAAMVGAAVNGHLDVVEFLHHHRTEDNPEIALCAAASWHQFHVVEYLAPYCSDEAITPTLEEETFYLLKIVQAFYRNCELGVSYAVLKAAVSSSPCHPDYREIIKFLLENQNQSQMHESTSLLKQAVSDSSIAVAKQILTVGPEISIEKLRDAMRVVSKEDDSVEIPNMLAKAIDQRTAKRKLEEFLAIY